MSGDVQPRKRREKKKKKEDGTEEVVFQQQHQTTTTTSPIVTDDLNIHIQKEASTGGGLCAKFVFFILLTALTTLIGLIITEHRGLTDLDAIDTESRFAQLFEGWIDAPSVDHESGEELSIEQSDEHAYEEDDHEEDDDDKQDQSLDHDDEEEEEEDDEDEEVSEEQATDENATEEEEEEEEKEESELQDDDTIENESEELEEDEDEQEEYEEEEEEPEYQSENEEVSDQEASSLPTKEDITQEEEEESQEDEPEDSEEAVDKTLETEESKYTAESEETADLTESEEAADEIPDHTESEEAADEAESEETLSADDVDELSAKQVEEDTTENVDETSKTAKVESDPKQPVTKVRLPNPEKKKTIEVSEDPDQPQETDNYNMAIKFGVGTALLVVAHVVLVQKWRTEEKIVTKKPQDSPEEAEPVTPDLSRRNTIVTPPSLQEIEQDIENVEEEYSEDDEDYDSDDDSRSKPTRAKMRYQELQSTYSHTLSPDWEPKEVRENRDKNYEEDEEEEEEPEGDDEEYDDEISETEDEELLKRLEQKYGRIQHSDEEPDDDADEGDNDDEQEEEEEEGDEDEEDDREDEFDSWKRVKVPSGNVPEDTDSENEKDWSKQHSGAQALYDFENITNSDDWQVREELDRAQQNLANDAAYALTLFNKILERKPSSPRALYGKAQSLDVLAEKKRSNNLLQQAIVNYQQVLQIKEVPDALFQLAAERCIDRMRFRGLYGQAIPIHKLLIEKFPEEPKFANNLAVTYLTTNKINEARTILNKTLLKWPNDGFALVHYGFILKTNDNNFKEAIKFLQKGIETKDPGVIDGRFYFHLGDALTRLGKNDEAMNIYLDGVANKVFLSKYQRSLYNVERLTGKPWWEKEQIYSYVQFFEQLENNWKIIRDEGLSILNQKGYFQPESENLRDVGDWKQFELYARGIKNIKNCKQCPITCKIVENNSDAIGCRRGQIKFSVMHPGTHVWPHCGPTNCRLRTHLGLKVPSNTFIRVGNEIRSWKEGKLLIFDDSFEHEVWHNGTDTRLVLIIDIWHPELTRREKQSLSSI